jgi:hypothetical protein
MNELKQGRRILTKISLAINIVFICGTIFIAYKFYPKIKSNFFPNKQEITAIQEAKLKDTDTIPTVFYDASEFEIIGQLFGNYQKTQQEFLFVFLPTLLKLKFVGL